jgi:hypothetical protein
MTNKGQCRLIDDTILAPMGPDPRIGQSTRSAKIELPAAARDARLKAGHDGYPAALQRRWAHEYEVFVKHMVRSLI